MTPTLRRTLMAVFLHVGSIAAIAGPTDAEGLIQRHIGHVFGFSVAGDEFPNLPSGRGVQPRYYLASGLWEESIDRCTSSLAEGLGRRGVSVEFSRRVAGHDSAFRVDEFAVAVQQSFGEE